jgi:hypothetical protein
MKKLVLVMFGMGAAALSAQIAGTWKWAPIGNAMAVGPAKGDYSWWGNPEAEVTGARACQFDDEFVFNADGSFQNVMQNETFLEGWQGSNGCGAPVAPHDGKTPATWSYDAAAGTLKLMGKGAHLGLAKVYNGGELADPANAPDSIVYEVSMDGNSMKCEIMIGGGAYWKFELVKVMPELNPVGYWQMRPVSTSLAVGPSKGNYAWWSVPAAEITAARKCMYDDYFVFNQDGSFTMDFQDETFREGWMGATDCGAPVAPFDGKGSYTYTANKDAATIALNGKGAFLGLPKVYNGGEINDVANAKDTIVYEAAITDDTMYVDIMIGGGAYWHFELVRVPEPSMGVATTNAASGVVLYPNPASDVLNVVVPGKTIEAVRVLNLQGSILAEVNAASQMAVAVPTTALADGTYLVQIQTSNGILTRRFVKN